MSNWKSIWGTSPYEPMIDYKDYAIGGKLITVSVRVSQDVMATQFTDAQSREALRQKLCEDLAQAMLSKKLVEINQQKNVDYTTTIVARAYVAPDETVKLLRTLDK